MMTATTQSLSPEETLHNLGYLHLREYQQQVAQLPPEQRAIKERLLPAFVKLIDAYQQKRFAEVNQITQTLLKAAPAHPEIFLTLGKICLDLIESAVKARPLFEAYTRLCPRDANGWMMFSKTLFNLADFETARQYGEKALKIHKKEPQLYLLMGKIHHSMRDFARAEYYNAKGLKYAPEHPVLLNNYGSALQFQGKRDEALDFYRKELQRNPKAYFAYEGLAHCSRDLTQEKELIEKAEAWFDKNNSAQQDEDIESLYFCLGRYYQKCGNKDKAWHYLSTFHQTRRQREDYTITDRIDANFAGLQEVFSKDYLHSPNLQRAKETRETSPIFIVGMPRSGTSLVEQILHSHSQITARGEMRELPAIAKQSPLTYGLNQPFPFCAQQLQQAHLQEMADRYRQALIPETLGTRYAVDKAPFNFLWLGLIYQLFPDAKIIHCLRSPMDVCLSVYENKFAPEHYWMHDLQDIAHYYNRYRGLMEHWQSALPFSTHPLYYEQLIADPESQIRSLLDYLELDWEENCLAFHKNKRTIDTLSVWQVKQPLYQSAAHKWKAYEDKLQSFIQGIGDYADYPF